MRRDGRRRSTVPWQLQGWEVEVDVLLQNGIFDGS